MLTLLNSFPHGGNISYNSGNAKISICGDSFKYSFPYSVSPTDFKEIWQFYQGRLGNTQGEVQEYSKSFNSIKDLAAKYGHEITIQPLPSSIESDPKGYLVTAKSLQALIKTIMHKNIMNNRSFCMKGTQYISEFDTAERMLIQTFSEICKVYIKNNELDKAYEAALKIRYSQKGTELLLNLILKHLENSSLDEVIKVLNRFPNKDLSSDAKQFFSSAKKLDRLDLLLEAIKKSNSEIKDEMLNHASLFLLKQNKYKEAEELISLIKESSSSNKAMSTIIKYYISKDQLDSALEIIRKITCSVTMNEEYKKIAAMYRDKGDIPKALEIIKKITCSVTMNEEYKKIAAMYRDKGDLPKALEIIKKITCSVTMNEEYKKIAAIYRDKKDMKGAVEVIKLITCSITQGEEYKKIALSIV
jgi:tetratricopeptide (TPR) repeat protein